MTDRDAARSPVLAGFSWTFLGIGLTRFWYQYNLYNLHFTADGGQGTVLANLVRVAVIAIMLAVTWKREFSPKVRNMLVWVSLALMTGASAFGFFEMLTGDQTLDIARYVVGGAGLVWGAGMWMDFFKRLEAREAFLYLSGGLALSCVLSLIGGYIPTYVMGLMGIFVPTFAVLAYLRAMHVLDLHEDTDASDRRAAVSGRDAIAGGMWQISTALIVYAFVMGMALGFPDGSTRDLSQPVRTIHQLIIVALLAWLVWWILRRNHRFTFSGMWYLENVLMILSIIILMAEQPWASGFSTFILTNAETLFFTFVFFVCYSFGRRSRRDSTWILGALYGATLLAMSLGRLFNGAMDQWLGTGVPQLVSMSVLVVVEMVVALRPDVLKDAPLVEGASGRANTEDGSHAVQGDDGQGARDHAMSGTNATVGSDDGACAASTGASDALVEPAHEADFPKAEEISRDVDEHLSDLRSAKGLTDVEVRIASLLACGRNRSYIAQSLGYSPNTIRNYTRSLYQKLDIHSKQELLDMLERQ